MGGESSAKKEENNDETQVASSKKDKKLKMPKVIKDIFAKKEKPVENNSEPNKEQEDQKKQNKEEKEEMKDDKGQEESNEKEAEKEGDEGKTDTGKGMKVSASQNFMEKCKKTFSLKRQRSSEKLKDETEEDKENIAPVSNEDSPKPNNENNGNLITKFKQVMNFKGKPKKKAKIENTNATENSETQKSDEDPAVEAEKAEELPKIENTESQQVDNNKPEDTVEVNEEKTEEIINESSDKVEVAEEAISTAEAVNEPESSLVTTNVPEVVAN